MPWGVNRDEIEPTLKRWNARLASVEFLYYRSPRGLPLLFARASRSIPFLRHEVPSLVHLTIRVALGMGCALDPQHAGHDEFAGIVPEKMEAFSNASMIALDRSADAIRQVSRLAYDEVMTTTRATAAMATCASPAALAKAQTNFVLGWFDRARSNFAAMGMLALSAQDAAIAPIRQSVHTNVERLNSGHCV